MRKEFSLLLLCFLSAGPLLAQSGGVEMADGLRADGKIWVVVVCVLIVLLLIAAFLWNTDRKLRRLENEIKK